MNNNSMTDDISYKGAKIILWAFVAFSIISYLYVLITGKYNGDFLGINTELSQWKLFLNFIYTIFPFFVLFFIYKQYKKVTTKYNITIPVKAFGQFLVFILFFHIIITFLYGVGKMGQEIYQAPEEIKLFIQIFNRFNPVFGVFLYVLVSGKNSKFHFLLYFLLIILSILKTSFGVFVYLALFMLIQYYESVFRFLRRKTLIVLLSIIILPDVVSVLYDFRNDLRDGKENYTHLKSSEIIFGKLVGRLSSYSNSAIILEQREKMKRLVRENFSSIQYPQEALTAFYGKIMDRNDITYSYIILECFGNHTRTTSFMTGTQGSLILGYYYAPFVFIINMITILIIVTLTFNLSLFVHYNKVKEFVFMFFCFNVMSGVASEYMSNLLCIMLYLCLFLVLNMFYHKPVSQ